MLSLVRFLFRFTLILWGTAITTALIGHFTGQDALVALSIGVRRFAPAVTAIWLAVALCRMAWMHFLARAPRPGRKRNVAPTNRLP